MKTAYLCDQKKECNKSFICGNKCKHTMDIKHSKNKIRVYPYKGLRFQNIGIEHGERMLIEEE